MDVIKVCLDIMIAFNYCYFSFLKSIKYLLVRSLFGLFYVHLLHRPSHVLLEAIFIFDAPKT